MADRLQLTLAHIDVPDAKLRDVRQVWNETKKYKKAIYTDDQKFQLRSAGFHPVSSSWVSAAAADSDDLYVRFHDGSIFQYKGKANLLNSLLKSASKGKWIWSEIIRKKVRGINVGKLFNFDDLDEPEFFDIEEIDFRDYLLEHNSVVDDQDLLEAIALDEQTFEELVVIQPQDIVSLNDTDLLSPISKPKERGGVLVQALKKISSLVSR